MIDATPRGTRRAALLLHALPAADRQWLLARLDDAQRQGLRPLLDELQTLGVQVEHADIALLMAPPPQDAPVDWRSAMPDEPPWMHALLADADAAMTPTARRALWAAAARLGGPALASPAPRLPPAAKDSRPMAWLDRMRRWLR